MKFRYNEESKAKMLEWAEVLESGKYVQHREGWGSLEKGALCCLNVALVEFTGKEAEFCGAPGPVDIVSELFHQPREETCLHAIQLWHWQFVKMNDDDGLTFPQIAAEIRKMVE